MIVSVKKVNASQVQTAKKSEERGRSLEELCSRLFASVAGFTVSGRLLTATEEIDISIINDSSEPRLRLVDERIQRR